MPEHGPAVFADVQVAVKPPVGRHVGGDVPTTATEIGHEYPATGHAAQGRGGAAHHHVLLVAVHDIGAKNFAEHGGGPAIGLLAAHSPAARQDAHAQPIDRTIAGFGAERHEARRHLLGHMPCELERISFGASDDAAGAKQRRDQMQHARTIHACHFTASSSIDRNHAGNIHAHRRS